MFSKFLKSKGLKYNVDYFRDVEYRTFCKDYDGRMNCDYVIHHNGNVIYIEIAGIIEDYKRYYYNNNPITYSKSKDKYRTKLMEKEKLLRSNDCVYFLLFPCDLTDENFTNILENPTIDLRKKIEDFFVSDIDWLKVREIGNLDYSQKVTRYNRRDKEAV